MHAKKAAFAIAALAASQANAFNTHRHKHFERDAVERLARAHEERAVLEERRRYGHTETVTTTLTVTEYVTEGDDAAAAPTAVFFETTEASSPAEEKATPTSNDEAEGGYVGGGEEAAAQQPTSTVEAVVETPAADEAIVVEEEPTTAATAAAAVATATGAACKRGVAYVDDSYGLEYASSSAICWGHNWGSGGDLGDGAVYVPTMWGPKENLIDTFVTNTQNRIAEGKAEAVFSLNEPDHSEGSDVPAKDQQSWYWLEKDDSGTINAAVSLHKEIMSQFAGQVLVGSPSVTSTWNANGKACDFEADGCDDEPYTDLASAKSVTWLKEFRSRCGDDCPMDFVNVHYYTDTEVCDPDTFKKFIGFVNEAFPDLPIWVTEFESQCDDATNQAFLQTTMDWMDSGDSAVARYSYFRAETSLKDSAGLKALYLGS